MHALENTSSASNEKGLPGFHAPKPLKRRLVVNLLVETALCMAIYLTYDRIAQIHPLVAPLLLGASSAALAQSINQYSKKKHSMNKIAKFVVWGALNGCFTVLWIDVLILQFDSLVHRIVVDQLVGAPMFQMIFNVLNSLWDTGEITAATRASYWKLLKWSYCFWPFFSVCLFAFIPQVMIFPANCLANLVWNLVLSKLA